ncbi:MAG: hypothetical protein ACRC2T_16095, partial [Thermoguttaceae bacterium]
APAAYNIFPLSEDKDGEPYVHFVVDKGIKLHGRVVNQSGEPVNNYHIMIHERELGSTPDKFAFRQLNNNDKSKQNGEFEYTLPAGAKTYDIYAKEYGTGKFPDDTDDDTPQYKLENFRLKGNEEDIEMVIVLKKRVVKLSQPDSEHNIKISRNPLSLTRPEDEDVGNKLTPEEFHAGQLEVLHEKYNVCNEYYNAVLKMHAQGLATDAQLEEARKLMDDAKQNMDIRERLLKIFKNRDLMIWESYKVSDLVTPAESKLTYISKQDSDKKNSFQRPEPESLITLIKAVCGSADAWQDDQSRIRDETRGSIIFKSSTLAIRQKRSVHEKIKDLLKQLRKISNPQRIYFASVTSPYSEELIEKGYDAIAEQVQDQDMVDLCNGRLQIFENGSDETIIVGLKPNFLHTTNSATEESICYIFDYKDENNKPFLITLKPGESASILCALSADIHDLRLTVNEPVKGETVLLYKAEEYSSP